MTDYKLLAEALFWVSVILLSPGLYAFTRAAIRYSFYRFVSNEKIILTIKKDGKPTQTVELDASGYVVDQIRNQFKAEKA